MIEALQGALAAATHGERIAFAVLVALLGHGVVLVLRAIGRFVARARGRLTPKVNSIIGLILSVAVFTIYFAAAGFVLTEIGVPLAAYLASASVIGLAVAFGSQNVVQDVVTGLTLIFADLLAVGDMVSIGGQSGRVEAVGMRFTTLRNPMGALIHVPNRSITNVVSYPSGYLRCLLDVQLLGDEAQRLRVIEAVELVTAAVHRQFAGIFVWAPSAEGRFGNGEGREYYRMKFRLWPDRGDVIDRFVREELLTRLRRIDPDYAPWMVFSAFEIEARELPAHRT
ncbi:MAG TPA: mechanosensitive ion channel domain-containing protein [Pseudomonadales bacterium]|nr:mechanosensitive ion channel domain-containing protein [Pseudomonadales bacterium]